MSESATELAKFNDDPNILKTATYGPNHGLDALQRRLRDQYGMTEERLPAAMSFAEPLAEERPVT